MRRWGPAAAWAGLIFVFSHQSLTVDPGVNHLDKAVHVIVFAILAAFLLWGFSDRGRRPPTTGRLIVAIGLTVLYGVFDEWHQSFVPGRIASTGDAAADAVGAVLGALLSGRLLPARAVKRP